MKKTLLFLAIFFIAASAGAFAQSAAKLSEYLDTEKLTNAQAAYLAACYKGYIEEDGDDQTAFDALSKDGLFSRTDSPESFITLESASLLYLKSTGAKGGLLYTITKSKRYAFKELKIKGILPESADPSMAVSGRDAIAIFNGCLELSGASGE